MTRPCLTVGALIGAGSDIDARDEAGMTPLLLAADAGHVIPAGFEGQPFIPDPVWRFTQSTDVIRALLQAGANLDARADDGRTVISILGSRDAALGWELLGLVSEKTRAHP